MCFEPDNKELTIATEKLIPLYEARAEFEKAMAVQRRRDSVWSRLDRMAKEEADKLTASQHREEMKEYRKIPFLKRLIQRIEPPVRVIAYRLVTQEKVDDCIEKSEVSLEDYYFAGYEARLLADVLEPGGYMKMTLGEYTSLVRDYENNKVYLKNIENLNK